MKLALKSWISLFIITLTFAVSSLQSATTALPVLEGHQVIAEWGGSKTFWTNPGPGGAPVSGVISEGGATPGSFTISSSVNASFGMPSQLLVGSPSFTMNAANFFGIAPTAITFQVAASVAPDVLSLTVGGNTYAFNAANLTTQSGFHTSGWNNARYQGEVFGTVILSTYTWDLAALGLSGTDLSAFTINMGMSGANRSIFDMQLSVAAVPEPSRIAFGAVALTAFILRRRRPKPLSQV